jgi:phosphomevalonate kinase
MSIRIIEIFVKLRKMILTNKDILLKLEKLENEVTGNKQDIKVIFNYLKQLLDPPQLPRRRIGYR